MLLSRPFDLFTYSFILSFLCRLSQVQQRQVEHDKLLSSQVQVLLVGFSRVDGDYTHEKLRASASASARSGSPSSKGITVAFTLSLKLFYMDSAHSLHVQGAL